MDWKIRLLVFGLGVGWLLLVLRAVKHGRIAERYSLVWVYVGIALVLTPLLVDVLDTLFRGIGVDEPPNLFFLLAIIGLLSIVLQCTMAITTLMRQSRDAVQALALLEARVRVLEQGQMPGPEGMG